MPRPWSRIAVPILIVLVVGLASEGTALATIAPSPQPGVWGTDGRVRVVLQVGTTTYIGGQFSNAMAPDGSTLPRQNLMALDASGQPTSWNPGADNIVLALASDGSNVFVGGRFTDIGKHIAEVSAAGTVLPFATANDEVRSLAVVGSRLYVAGQFTKIARQEQPYLAALTLTGGFDAGFTPNVNGYVYGAEAFTNGNLLIGGTFTSVNGSNGSATAAIVTATGASGPALSQPPTDKVLSVRTSGTQGVLGVGGSGNAGYAYDQSGARLWRVGCNGDVQASVFADGRWLIGGHFGTCSQQTAPKLVIVNANGTLDTSWKPQIKGSNVHGVWALDATPSLLIAGGDFDTTAGQSTPHVAEWAIT